MSYTFEQIGNGIIFNGDCLEVMEQLANQNYKIDLCLCDPPYAVNFSKGNYDDSKDTILPLIPKWFDLWYKLLKDDCYLFLFVGVKNIEKWIQIGIDTGFTFKNILATRSYTNGTSFSKNNFGFEFQPVLVFSKGKGKNFNQVDFIPTSEDWFKDKRNKNPKPYTYAYPNWIKTEWAFATEKRASKNLHPNEKNVKLQEFLIKLTTNENDLVMDCFMGSASCGLASLNTNRKFIGIELDKNYYEIAKNRIKESIK